MAELDLTALDEALSSLHQDHEYWIHLDASSEIDKYPGQHIELDRIPRS